MPREAHLEHCERESCDCDFQVEPGGHAALISKRDRLQILYNSVNSNRALNARSQKVVLKSGMK